MDDSDFRHWPLCDKGMAVGTTTRRTTTLIPLHQPKTFFQSHIFIPS